MSSTEERGVWDLKVFKDDSDRSLLIQSWTTTSLLTPYVQGLLITVSSEKHSVQQGKTGVHKS